MQYPKTAMRSIPYFTGTSENVAITTLLAGICITVKRKLV